jgi:MerR family transcriptional regulator/heat shock protein HspR
MHQRPRTQVRDKTRIPSEPPPSRPEQVSLASQASQEEPQGSNAEDRVMLMEGVYIISVAARILEMHPQTLRKYERLGLINPGRTLGMLRLYSAQDIRRLRLIRHLVGNLGLNLAGVEFTLNMVENLLNLRDRLASLAEGTPLESEIRQEFDRLFYGMDLPVSD